ncbi:pirin family protein [Microvirga sp. STS02]|uniref:pirin family protein n=1 Tax=Hymenobacter negativus TaxID=2795026 RepID=UPI0018DD2247|nr:MULTISPECIES: pirin family protein [Bacteria]MBH8570093.1 pirin family protein [Hymenobacter negativus]MBR7209833.1 pirin family protein [Microvirga sp. STS02]
MRTIKQQHRAVSAPIADLTTYRALPTNSVEYIDPFLFLNHHGPQVYRPNNRGLPFGPHPHRGFETVTFILEGDILHKDSSGHESVIEAGGIQWMTAGSGLIHAEVSSENFKAHGGPLEILQLWVNLPAKNKMTAPRYIGLQKDEIPAVTLDGGVVIHAVSGEWAGTAGAVQPLADVALAWLELPAGSRITLPIAAARNIFFYTVRGTLRVNDTETKALQLVEFNHDGDELTIAAHEASVLLLGHAQPFGEPMVSAGPFVMNTDAEIQQAYRDYQRGAFGSWNG